MTAPKLLDLFCKAGGATRGYQEAGFHVTGVDIEAQPHYCGDAFHQADALDYLAAHGHEYDAIHASPPCQKYTVLRSLHPGAVYPDLVGETRAALEAVGRPWVIENVPGAPLHAPILLCGTMFGLRVYRHRLFECPALLLSTPRPYHPPHTAVCVSANGIGRKARFAANTTSYITVTGHGPNVGREAMGIDWMNRGELSQAIPPAYTRWIGERLMAVLQRERVAS